MNIYYCINRLEQKRYSTYNHIYSLVNEFSDRFGIRDKKYDKTLGENEQFSINFISYNITPIMLEAEFQPIHIKTHRNFVPFSLKKLLHNSLRLPLVSPYTQNKIMHYFDFPIYKSIRKSFSVLELSSITNISLPEFFHKKSDPFLFTRNADGADRIIVHSDFMKQELVSRLFIAEDRITVISKGIKDGFFNIAKDAETIQKSREDHQIPDKFIMFAGKISRYKNLDRLIRVFAKSAPRQYSLVIAGSFDTRHESYRHAHSYMKYLMNLAGQAAPGRIKFTGYVRHDIMPAVMYNATALIEPSFHNNFPDSIAEAQAVGIPVIASDIDAHRSVCTNSVLYFSCLSEKSMAEAIEAVINDSKTRSTLIDKGKRKAAAYSWELTAPSYGELYNSFS
ncbi:MAG: glycosyltransferase family 4 protein [Oligoflexia bacterium]|nr:glycosyltransferase family 4 protein [Oligoflexia bacterium]